MKKSNLRATAALQALALLGAGVPVAFFGAAPASAQDYTRGVLQGTITDAQGTPIAGAEVTVRSNEQGYQTTTLTDANGTFRATALATGTYTVLVRKADQTLVEDRAVNVVAGRTNTYGYTSGGEPQLGGTAANQNQDTGGTIVVTGRRVQVDDFATTQTGANLDVAEVAQTVPVGRDQTSLILLAPGTTAGDGGFGNLASISGATVAENSYFVNGLNITDFRNFLGGSTIPFEFYRTLDVKTGGYQAEYGRALGGVTSAVTKSGTNELQGGAVVSYAPDFLREQSPNTYLARNEDDETTTVDGNFYLSGPLIRDRVFLYGLYSPRSSEFSDTSISARSRLRTTSSTPFWGVKADAVIFPGHRLEGTMFSDKQTSRTSYQRYDVDLANDPDGENGTLGGLRGNVINKSGGRNWIATYTGQFTDFLTLSASHGRNRDTSTQSTSPNQEVQNSRLIDCSPVCGGTSGSPVLVGGTVGGRFTDDSRRKFYRADADVYANLFGKHHFRGGFDYEDLTAGEDTGLTGNGFTYNFLPTRTLRRRYFNQGSFDTNMRAFYLQDSWTLLDERLTLNLGVRNDRFRNYNQAGEKYYDSGSSWAPRIGATFDVFGDRRTKLNAFFGRYYLPIATNTNIRLAGSELFYQQSQLNPIIGVAPNGTPIRRATDANGDGIPDQFTFDEFGNVNNFTPNQGGANCPGSFEPDQLCQSVFADGTLKATDTTVAEGLKPSRSSEFILGLSHRFGDGWSAGVDFTRRRLDETLDDVAIDLAVRDYCDREGIEGCDAVFYGFHQYVLANPGSDITVRLAGDDLCDDDPRACEVVTLSAEDLGYPKAVRKYDSVQFTLDKGFNGFWSGNFNYVYTKLRGNYEGAVKSDNNQTDAGLTQDFDQPGFLEGATGDLANLRKHSFKAFGRVRPLSWLDVGVNAILESPRKFSCIGNYRNSAFSPGGQLQPEFFYGAASYFCQQQQFADNNSGAFDGDGDGVAESFLVPRGTAFKSQWNRRVDLGLGFDLSALSDALAGSQFRIDVFNVFNWKQKLDRQEFGDVGFAGANPDYGRVTGFQAPRSVRFTLATRFGQVR